MTEKRYSVTCRECGELESDMSSGGLFDKATVAHRRAGFHEGSRDDHSCTVEVAEATPEFQCPICMTTVTGERERDSHAQSEPGLKADGMERV